MRWISSGPCWITLQTCCPFAHFLYLVKLCCKNTGFTNWLHKLAEEWWGTSPTPLHSKCNEDSPCKANQFPRKKESNLKKNIYEHCLEVMCEIWEGLERSCKKNQSFQFVTGKKHDLLDFNCRTDNEPWCVVLRFIIASFVFKYYH